MNFANIAFLLVGVIGGLMALVGMLGALKGTPVRVVKSFGRGERPAVDDPAFRDTVEMLVHAQLAHAHAVEIFINGDQTYPRFWDDLRAARESITIQLYYCEPGKMANTFRDILVERSHAGVKILFLVDAFGSARVRAGGQVVRQRA